MIARAGSRASSQGGWLLGLAFAGGLAAQPFDLPTANHALLEKGAGEAFYVGTVGKPWSSGGFGCVRSDGAQFHEGLDIRCLERDARGEPTDPVRATAAGTVVYFNNRPAWSNYGRYVVLRHAVEGLEVYSLYAHLRAVREDLKKGQAVRAGEPLGVLGRSSNTRPGIAKDRAHVHFELDLLVNERFATWHHQHFPNQRNDHGMWNGRNLLGINPEAVFLEQARLGTNFSLHRFLGRQTELCRVVVRVAQFSWLRRYPALVVRSPAAEKDGVAGYELALTFNGLPFQLIPRTAAEIKKQDRIQLVSVNEREVQAHPCGRILARRQGRWELHARGQELLDLLLHQ